MKADSRHRIMNDTKVSPIPSSDCFASSFLLLCGHAPDSVGHAQKVLRN
jgi:hypothetical protein